MIIGKYTMNMMMMMIIIINITMDGHGGYALHTMQHIMVTVVMMMIIDNCSRWLGKQAAAPLAFSDSSFNWNPTQTGLNSALL